MGGITVPIALLAVVAAGLRDGPEPEPRQGTTTAEQAVPAKPESEPTRQEFVPPRPPPPTTRAPRPLPVPVPTKVKPTRKPQRQAERARPCPQGWADIPFLRRWCERHGYSTR